MEDTDTIQAKPKSHIRVLNTVINPFGTETQKDQEVKLPNPTSSVLKEYLLWVEGALDNLIKAAELGYLKIKIPEDTNEILDIELLPITNLPHHLGHVTHPEDYSQNNHPSIWGNHNPNEYTYLQTTDFSVETFQESDYMISLGKTPKQFYRLYIDTQLLLSERNVYLDMESIDTTPKEFGKSFVILGGIPKSSITKSELIEISPQPLSAFTLDPMNKFDQDKYLEMAVNNEAKLEEFLRQLSQKN